MKTNPATLLKVRWLTFLFIVGLVVSGVTAIPLRWEVDLLSQMVDGHAASNSVLAVWLIKVRDALRATEAQYRFLFYGTDWLAFGHIVIAVAFVGAWRDPVRNIWLFEFGLIACVLVIPWALVFGPLRGIPFFWRLIDCSFGVFGFFPLWWARKLARELELGEKVAVT